MGQLENPKHELFAQALIKHNGRQTEAYMEVYPKSKYDSARHSAAILLTNAYIRERIRQLLGEHGLGVAELLKKLKDLTEATRIIKAPTCNMLSLFMEYSWKPSGWHFIFIA